MFRLIATGPRFDPEQYEATESFQGCRSWRRGDLLRSGRPHSNGGLELFLGDGQKLRLDQQIGAAIEFLDRNEFALLDLSGNPAVEHALLYHTSAVGIVEGAERVFVVSEGEWLVSIAGREARVRVGTGEVAALHWGDRSKWQASRSAEKTAAD